MITFPGSTNQIAVFWQRRFSLNFPFVGCWNLHLNKAIIAHDTESLPELVMAREIYNLTTRSLTNHDATTGEKGVNFVFNLTTKTLLQPLQERF